MNQLQRKFLWPIALIIIATFIMMIAIIGGFINPEALMI